MVLRQCQHTWHVFIHHQKNFISFICREKFYLNGLFYSNGQNLQNERYSSVGYPVMHLIHVKPKIKPNLPGQHNISYILKLNQKTYGIMTKNYLTPVNVWRINLCKHFAYVLSIKIRSILDLQSRLIQRTATELKRVMWKRKWLLSKVILSLGSRNEDLAIKYIRSAKSGGDNCW